MLNRLFDRQHGAIIFIAKTTLASWCLVFAIDACVFILLAVVGDTSQDSNDKIPLPPIYALLAFAPLLENFLLAGIIEFLLIFTSSRYVIVSINAVIFGIIHFLTTPGRGVAGFIGFATMAMSYLVWYESRFSKRFAIILAQHVLFNASTYALVNLGNRFLSVQ